MNDFDIPLFQKTYNAYREFYECLKNFPKGDRYAIGQRTEQVFLALLSDIIRASKAPRLQKGVAVGNAQISVGILRVCIRLSKDVRALNLKQYISLEEKVDEIGRMLGGWKRSLE